ncbi:TetR family transcriptional regulator [Humibacillus xanthopallidus]|uniref:TetR family transcriptional regulator n=1 Tax=Humibacillus xanthopallidus TaxID=412689 RepID=A0A543PKB2_9MICO|nr:TetR/AcrR family transcriptional regulator [Humibacillus xanthopallidus]TQN44515.1 TetR family transcriptional regulator [Humibacillus xanthopallidus]
MSDRPALSRARIVDAAARVADRRGLAGVSMRNVGAELGVEAMSLYHHLSGKDDLLDGLADWVFTGIELPDLDQPWRPAMSERAASSRARLAAHPWALGLIESRRNPGPALLHHHDTVLGCLRTNGFTVALAAHAFSAIDAYVYGFVLTELNLPMESGEQADVLVAEMALPVGSYPYLAEMMTEQVLGKSYAYAAEFDFGLGLILDGLEERLEKLEES